MRGARIAAVEPGSPAARVGLQPGMTVATVEGQVPRDIIDWRWLASEGTVSLTLKTANQNNKISCTLTRAYGEDWGITFADPLFDQLMTCCNSCSFCFMTMLPKGMRPALYLRDDDYRLSFLQGNFVTLTNMDDAQVERVIEQHLAPLHVSLHAVRPEARRRLMGANHARGLEVLERLLDAGIEMHTQVVLVPGDNDGEELDATLTWIEQRPRIISAGIVPYGFTKYAPEYAQLQTGFTPAGGRAVTETRETSPCLTGFTPAGAQAVVRQVAAFQQRSRAHAGRTRFQLADEWYLLAGSPLPPAGEYDGYPQFEDGIGMVRSFIDDWEALSASQTKGDGSYVLIPQNQDIRTVPFCPPFCPHVLVTGEAFAPILRELLAASPFADRARVRAIENRFFGGNVNVAGLLTARDIIEQLGEAQLQEEGLATIVLPSALFNVSGLTLDDQRASDIAFALNRQVDVVPYTAEGLFSYLLRQ